MTSLFFDDYKDTRFLWVTQILEPFLFQNKVKACRYSLAKL